MTGKSLGPYRVLELIGQGGMGEVYRARDTKLDRDVALKILPTAFASDPDRLMRFEREAKTVAALSHPNILSIFDFGVQPSATGQAEGTAYAVMELLEGDTLRARLQAGPLPLRKAIEYAVQVARGLSAAHDRGVVHRDLKPENIFLVADGQVKILDFGLARPIAGPAASGSTETGMALTDPGTVLGTIGYMAPEQVRGQDVDARSDLFAFGAVLYEMLAGRRAFQRDTPADTMTAILGADPPELDLTGSGISPALDRIVRHCLEKHPNERFQTARDVAFALESLSGSGSAARHALDLAPPRPTSPRSRRLMWAAAVAAALAIGLTAGSLLRPAPALTDAEPTFQRVTFEEGFVFAARFAKDGRTIAYSADWEGLPQDVFVTSVDSPEFRPLGLPGAHLLALSAAGDLAILATSELPAGNPYLRRGTLARVAFTGGAPRPVLEGASFADVAADGTMALVRADGDRLKLEFPAGTVLQEMSMLRFAPGAGQAAFTTPRISPDGTHVAFFAYEPGGFLRVKIFDRSGRMAAQSQPLADWWSLAWTPAGEVWYSGVETGVLQSDQTTMFALDLAGRERVVYRPPGSLTLHDISAEGSVLASIDNGWERTEILDAGAGSPRDRSWREGGRWEAYSSGRVLFFNAIGASGGPNGSAFIWRPDDDQPVRIAEGFGRALSPDGQTALVSPSRQSPQLSLVPTGVGQPRPFDVGPVESIGWAGWLPDGRLLIEMARPGSEPRVYAVPGGGGAPVAVLPENTTLRGNNLVSPDGSQVVASEAGGRYLLCQLAGAACRPLPGAEPGDTVAGWSADGTSVFLYRRHPIPVRIDRLDVASGRRVLWKDVRPLRPAPSGLRTLQVSPDGTVVYGYRIHRTQLYVIRGLR